MADVKESVRERYGAIAAGDESCCSPEPQSTNCCGPSKPDATSQMLGYSADDLAALPEGANLGLGCGNPTALAGLQQGETVVDLGSGAGIDCFLAAKQVGETGSVIGVDMTPQMLEKARANAEKGGYKNVEFREGEIEKLPVDDNSVDVVISNCVINLSPDKDAVFSEIYRVLKPGGRFHVSDIVQVKPLPDSVKASTALLTACVAGALLKDDYLGKIGEAGFSNVDVDSEQVFPIEMLAADPNFTNLPEELKNLPPEDVEYSKDAMASVKVHGFKAAACSPGAGCC